MWRNTHNGWGIVSIALHWLSAVAIIGLFILGWWMTGLDYFHGWYNLGPWWHRSVGMLVLFATLARLIWRFGQPTPLAHGQRMEKLAAHFGHVALYVLMLVVMISGYMISTANGRGINVFGWFEVPALVYDLPNQESLAGTIHWYSALLLMLMALGHTVAALKHHWVDHYDTLLRMLDPRRAR